MKRLLCVTCICGCLLPLDVYGDGLARLERLVHSQQNQSGEELIPAQWSRPQDDMGQVWDIGSYGVVQNGQNNTFSGALRLSINGSNFSSSNSRMTKDGLEYVLFRKMNNVFGVTRRILIDKKRGAARFLEVIENQSDREQQVTLQLYTHFGQQPGGAFTTTGKDYTGGALDRKDVGLGMASSGSHTALFIFTSPGAEIQPEIETRNNYYELLMKWSFKLSPKETKSFVHILAQRPTSTLTAKTVASEVKAFYRGNLIRPQVPREIARTIVNFRMGPALNDAFDVETTLREVLAAAESVGAERDRDDVLAMNEDVLLHGEALSGDLKVKTAYGETTVSLSEVLMIRGGSGIGLPVRLYLRNGEVLTGLVEAPGFKMKTESGLEIELDPNRIWLLFKKLEATDGYPYAGTAGYLETARGERLALAGLSSIKLNAVTPWGGVELSLRDLESLQNRDDGLAVKRFSLADKSLLHGLVRGGPVQLETVRFGPLAMDAGEICGYLRVHSMFDQAEQIEEGPAPEWKKNLLDKLRAKVSVDIKEKPFDQALKTLAEMGKFDVILDQKSVKLLGDMPPVTVTMSNRSLQTAIGYVLAGQGFTYRLEEEYVYAYHPGAEQTEAQAAPPEEDDAEFPFFELAGANVMVGTFSLPEITLLTPVGRTTISTAGIRHIEANAEMSLGTPAFDVELHDGTKLCGTLDESLVAVKARQREWQVPVHHILTYSAPKPKPPAPPEGDAAAKEAEEAKPLEWPAEEDEDAEVLEEVDENGGIVAPPDGEAVLEILAP
ncbi:MAG: hypothetical protein JW909_01050 [Planctomycetes bacterium]|nr:hypothetical protein [Planctomycetota bacterium]